MTLKVRVARLEQKSPRNQRCSWRWPQDARTIARALAFAIERHLRDTKLEQDR